MINKRGEAKLGDEDVTTTRIAIVELKKC